MSVMDGRGSFLDRAVDCLCVRVVASHDWGARLAGDGASAAMMGRRVLVERTRRHRPYLRVFGKRMHAHAAQIQLRNLARIYMCAKMRARAACKEIAYMACKAGFYVSIDTRIMKLIVQIDLSKLNI